MKLPKKISPCLWFDGKAEEAAKFYVSIFKNAKITNTMYYGDAGHGPKGSVLTVTFELDGQEFVALNGGPHYSFTPAVSFFIPCDTQEEVDHFWTKLTAGGQEVQCGWLKDKFGMAWQVVPTVMIEMLRDKDPQKAKRVTAAMLQMKKIDIATLKKAHEGRAAAA